MGQARRRTSPGAPANVATTTVRSRSDVTGGSAIRAVTTAAVAASPAKQTP